MLFLHCWTTWKLIVEVRPNVHPQSSDITGAPKCTYNTTIGVIKIICAVWCCCFHCWAAWELIVEVRQIRPNVHPSDITGAPKCRYDYTTIGIYCYKNYLRSLMLLFSLLGCMRINCRQLEVWLTDADNYKSHLHKGEIEITVVLTTDN